MKIRMLLLKLMLLTVSLEALASGPSFDCGKASTSVEKLICSDKNLSELDAMLSLGYKDWLEHASDRDVEKQRQREWVKNERNICTDAGCIAKAYEKRLEEISTQTHHVDDVAQVASGAIIVPSKAVEQPMPVQPAQTQSKQEIPAIAQPTTTNQPAPIQTTVSTAQTIPAAPSAALTSVQVNSDNVTASKPFKFPFTFSDVFHLLFAVGMLALMAGMIRPALATRFINVPTRKRIFISMLFFLVPVAVISEVTKTPEEKAHDLMVKQDREAERRAKEIEDRPSRQANNQTESANITQHVEGFWHCTRADHPDISVVFAGGDITMTDATSSTFGRYEQSGSVLTLALTVSAGGQTANVKYNARISRLNNSSLVFTVPFGHGKYPSTFNCTQ